MAQRHYRYQLSSALIVTLFIPLITIFFTNPQTTIAQAIVTRSHMSHVLPESNSPRNSNGNGDDGEENISLGVITPISSAEARNRFARPNGPRLVDVPNPHAPKISLPEEGEQAREEALHLEYLRKNQQCQQCKPQDEQ